MIKHISIAFFIAIFAGHLCEAQLRVTSPCWGQEIHGIRLSIGTATNVISPTSMVVVNAQIENTSTNEAAVQETASWKDFSIWLENALGEKFLLTDNSKSIIEHRNFINKIHPGEIDSWEIRLIIRKEIKLGSYMMKATRKIKLNGEQFVVESNPLKIQIE